jgi:hypothetical protein
MKLTKKLKKQRLLITVVLLVVLAFAARQMAGPPVSSEEFEPAPPLQICQELENYVSMTAVGMGNLGSFLGTSALIIQNDSNLHLVSLVGYYRLEIYADGQWRSVPATVPRAVTGITLDILPHESERAPVDISAYRPLGEGRYRIRKQVSADLAVSHAHDVVAEFRWG